ncbi:MAG TPA: hypothetical protein DCE42_26850 [Myxococcales bacterium]|nr:hypothetical protein [Deltaproteobacteria bacterium]MBU51365.1 hypothetical protein [Deltaproteobacteria bacterium]HAA58411.1 hypothetical protein [Myxococcales bacterium]|tara:strand:- start:52 stop:660 length:609 start_codon:yes stop_codon:yes gene_type:complete
MSETQRPASKEDQEQNPEATNVSTEDVEMDEARESFHRLGKRLILVLYVIFVGGFTLAIFISAYQAVTTQPNVLLRSPQGKYTLIKPRHLKKCVKRLRGLDHDLEETSKDLWFKMRHGDRNGRHLLLWKDFSKNWRHRMEALEEQCPISQQTELGASFTQTITALKKLQRKQEKTFYDFFKDTKPLFHKIHKHIDFLREETR